MRSRRCRGRWSRLPLAKLKRLAANHEHSIHTAPSNGQKDALRDAEHGSEEDMMGNGTGGGVNGDRLGLGGSRAAGAVRKQPPR